MHTYLDLEAQAAQLLKQAEELRLQERTAAIAQAKAIIEQHHLSAAELGLGLGSNPKKRHATQSPAKYRGPNGELWSGGRGRKPQWVHEVLKSGKSLEDFAIRSH